MTTKNKNNSNFEDDEDEIIARIEFSDGNSFKQIVEFFKNTVSLVPLAFYKDRLVITRGNFDETIINESTIDKTDFLLDYYVNPEFFNHQSNVKLIKQKVKVIQKEKVIEDGKTIEKDIIKFFEETIEVPDPRHIFIPNKDTFHKQVKSIAKRDGFRIIIYKYSDKEYNEMKNNSKNRKIENPWIPDSYMKAMKISGNSSSNGEFKIGSENVEEYVDYTFKFDKPSNQIPNQKIRLSEICDACSNYVKLKIDFAHLMSYPRGFKIMPSEKIEQEPYKWGICNKKKKNKGKIIIDDPDSEYDLFGVPLDLLKAISKLQPVSGNGGIASIRSNEFSLEILIPILSIGQHKITIIPSNEDTDE